MNTQSDVVIIGGGIIGLCTAHYLRRGGARVTIIEKGKVGQACSLKNAGFITPSHFVPLAAPGIIAKGLKWLLNPESPFYIKPRLNLDLLSWLWKFRGAANEHQVHKAAPVLYNLNMASSALYDELVEREGLRFGLEHRGILMLHNSPQGEKANREEAAYGQELGLRVRILSRDEVNALDPGIQTVARGAVHFEDDSHLIPEQFIEAMKNHLLKHGVAMKEETKVVGVKTSGTKVTGVQTSRGIVQGDTFVLSGGSWSPGLAKGLGLKLPLQPGKGYSVNILKPERMFRTPLILTEARVAITPMGDFIRFAGTMELAGLDLSINRRRVEAILKAVPRYLSGFQPTTLTRSEPWAGLRPCTPDGLPYIGRFRTIQNLVVATGHAMMGVSLAPITGKLVSELILTNSPSMDISPLDVERFS